MEIEFIKESIKPSRKRKGEYAEIIERWLATDNKTLVFKCRSDKEVRSAKAGACGYRKKHNEDYVVFCKNMTVYVVRA